MTEGFPTQLGTGNPPEGMTDDVREVYEKEIKRLLGKYSYRRNAPEYPVVGEGNPEPSLRERLQGAFEVQKGNMGFIVQHGKDGPESITVEFADGAQKTFQNAAEALVWVEGKDGLIYKDKDAMEAEDWGRVSFGKPIEEILRALGK